MSVIIRPVITEKANYLSDLRNVYTFLVKTSANKIQIKQDVETAYGVKVQDVRTMIYAPKVSTRYTKKGMQTSKTNKLKKAMVKLTAGEVIDIFATE